MRAPQIVMAVFIALTLLVMAHDHGKPKKGNDNFWIALASWTILTLIMWWGGFWK